MAFDPEGVATICTWSAGLQRETCEHCCCFIARVEQLTSIQKCILMNGLQFLGDEFRGEVASGGRWRNGVAGPGGKSDLATPIGEAI